MGLYGHRDPLGSLAAFLAALLLAACSPSGEAGSPSRMETLQEDRPVAYEHTEVQEATEETAPGAEEAGSPPPVGNVYEAAKATEVRGDLAGIPERVYVPNIVDGTVSVVDPETFEIVDVYEVGELPYHVTPSWDMKKLYVNNEASGTFTVIDPKTGRPSGTVEAPFPYNFYYTPDGEKAVVVAERLQTLEFRDPRRGRSWAASTSRGRAWTTWTSLRTASICWRAANGAASSPRLTWRRWSSWTTSRSPATCP